ncbi:unnamed protein product [Blepharisma stoltei]|uniref:Uncharacterized protein n=1 Tax=Blepharisma stoltei TaxID=1481888 RepID=A0AAU9JET8_9CILI|nr:unnamed protein product [Blepharisma stoltei]
MLEGEVKSQPIVEKIKENQVIMDDLQEIIAELSSSAVKADTLLEEIVSQAWRMIYSAYLFDHFAFILTFARIQLESYLQETFLRRAFSLIWRNFQ